MSIELLDPPPGDSEVANAAQHDLETLFYVFVWICSLYAAPGVIRDFDKGSASDSIIVLKWNEVKDSREVGEIKRSHLSYGGNKVAACFTPYFASLRGCCVQLLNAIFPKGSEARADYRASLSPVTHDQIITIFKAALELVLKEERAEGVNTIDSGAMNTPNRTMPKRQLGEIADLEQYSARNTRVHTAPIHDVIYMRDLPEYAKPRRKRVRVH